jgi:hypothetical protein
VAHQLKMASALADVPVQSSCFCRLDVAEPAGGCCH